MNGEQWHHAVSDGFVGGQTFAPLVHLVGMKKDLRESDFADEEGEDEPGRARTTASFAAHPTCSVGPSEVSQLLSCRRMVLEGEN